MNEKNTNDPAHASVLVVGASRGLGLAIVEEYARRGAEIVATVRSASPPALRELTEHFPVDIDRLDVTDAVQIDALAERLSGRRFDLLFVVAGVSLAPSEQPAADIANEDFAATMLTNALGAMRAAERLGELVTADGTIAVMSSGQGSVTQNTSGGFEVYRASKAALNQLMRSYAARHPTDRRALLLLAPGWIRTDMGGDAAGLDIEEAIPPLIDTVESQRGIPGLRYLDRRGATVPW